MADQTEQDQDKGIVSKALDEIKATNSSEYDVYEVVGEGELSHVATVIAPDKETACWRAVEATGTPLNEQATGETPPTLRAVSVGRNGLSPAKQYGLEAVQTTRRRNG